MQYHSTEREKVLHEGGQKQINLKDWISITTVSIKSRFIAQYGTGDLFFCILGSRAQSAIGFKQMQ